MKRILSAAFVLVTAVTGYGQGTINFSSFVGTVDAPVTYLGARVTGPAYVGQLYAGATAGSLAAVGSPVAFFGAGTGGEGYIVSPATVTVPGIAGGATAVVQMKAWASTFASYEAAVAGGGVRGESTTFSITLGGGGSPPAVPANLVGLQAFSLVPEPSTYALLAFGAAALLLRRRKV
jgi:hypothetical protein